MKLAIIKLSSLGDIVHAMLALQFIKSTLPELKIDWLVEQRFSGILEDNPLINQILLLKITALKSRKSLIFQEYKKLKHYANNHYDLVIDAQGLIKSAVVSRLLSKNSLGFNQNSIREKPAAWFYQKTFNFSYAANSIERNLAILTHEFGLKIDKIDILNKQAFLFFHTPSLNLETFFSNQLPNVVFVIGSTWPSRNYPKEQYLAVIKQLQANCLIIYGNEEEKLTADWLASNSHARVIPKISINDLKFLISRAALIIGNDTGPTHMAWALNRPSLTLFGPTPITRVYQTPINKVLKSPSLVNPYKLNKNDFSIKDIPVDAVITEAEYLLSLHSQ